MVSLSCVLVTVARHIYVMSPQIPVIETADEGLVQMGIYLSKALTRLIFSCINKNCFFIKETDTFGSIVV